MATSCFLAPSFSRSHACLRWSCEQSVASMNAKTAAQRQAERKARELAAGRVQWKRWVHPDDVPALVEFANKLARKRARSERAG
jgi:hypothetical protein